ncbi:unnamed protein product [Enterobius vermicularis]|uniref:Neuropeptide-Like Protein n=1 Tax=Enterobius vermicularis TaxID=51028 RepID=A0A0N4USE4_ENTVE|nr:unnamed protein product [Enterobius vermicularis]
MCKVPAAFIVLIVASMQVGCANLHLFGMVGSNPQNPLRSGDAEMRRAYNLHNLNMMASLNHMNDIIAQKEPFLKRRK